MSNTQERSIRARRDAAIARPELRRQRPFIKVEDKLPEIGRPVIAYASDGQIYRIPFPVIYRGDDKWSNLKHDRTLETTIVGWLYVG
jgi:hypothetical protein